MFSPSKIFSTRCHGAEVHAACAGSNANECYHHDCKWPASFSRRRSSMIGQRCQKVSESEENPGRE